jgi:GDP/UDP-N,N'-diacetylbacillosamine 2-epimerase (hydrolysing)
MHKFGNTQEQIENDGFKIRARINDGLKGDKPGEIVDAIGRVTMGFGEVFSNLKPDMLVVLGDRSELIAAVTSAVIFNIPVAHIHGGETTEGAYDELFRHAITKMSHLHFVSHEVYRKRIIQMGELPSRVFTVGAIGVDSIRSQKLLDRRDFERSISMNLNKKSALITFHPSTMENATAEAQFIELLRALDNVKEITLIFTKPNSDRDGSPIITLMENYISNNQHKAIGFDSLGQLRYLSALQHVDFVIGNSSSGILEVPYFNIPTINIGDRQKGRLAPPSVIHCEPVQDEITEAISKAYSPEFLLLVQNQKQLFGDGNTTEKILEKIEAFDFRDMKKSFYDIKDFSCEKLS